MAINLSTTSSIVDYLGTQGKDSSFQARKKLYDEMGLNTRLGDYVGSSSQNTSFLNALRSSSDKPLTENGTMASKMILGQNTPTSPYGMTKTTGEQVEFKLPTSATTPAQNAIQTVTPKSQPIAQSIPKPAEQVPTTTPQSETSASETLQTLGIDLNRLNQPMAPEDVIRSVSEDPAFKLYTESIGNKMLGEQAVAEAKKQGLEQKYESDKNTLEQKLAESGLAFSGIRTSAVKDLTESLATSTLALDREMANKLLETDVNVKEKFLDLAADIIKKYDDGNKDAVDQLNKAGYSVLGGNLVPTAELLRINQTANTAEFNKNLQLARLEISKRLATTAEERNVILNEIRRVNLEKSTATSPGQVINAATGLPVDLTQTESETLSRNQMAKEYYIPSLQDMLKGVESGAIVGKLNKYTAKTPIAQYLRNEDLSMFNALASYFSQQIVYMNSGKQINETEMRILQQSLPNAELTVDENRKRLKQFAEITNNAFSRYLKLNGWAINDNPQTSSTNELINETGSDLSDLDFTFD